MLAFSYVCAARLTYHDAIATCGPFIHLEPCFSIVLPGTDRLLLILVLLVNTYHVFESRAGSRRLAGLLKRLPGQWAEDTGRFSLLSYQIFRIFRSLPFLWS